MELGGSLDAWLCVDARGGWVYIYGSIVVYVVVQGVGARVTARQCRGIVGQGQGAGACGTVGGGSGPRS